jgi:hypothetical protein
MMDCKHGEWREWGEEDEMMGRDNLSGTNSVSAPGTPSDWQDSSLTTRDAREDDDFDSFEQALSCESTPSKGLEVVAEAKVDANFVPLGVPASGNECDEKMTLTFIISSLLLAGLVLSILLDALRCFCHYCQAQRSVFFCL